MTNYDWQAQGEPIPWWLWPFVLVLVGLEAAARVRRWWTADRSCSRSNSAAS